MPSFSAKKKGLQNGRAQVLRRLTLHRRFRRITKLLEEGIAHGTSKGKSGGEWPNRGCHLLSGDNPRRKKHKGEKL